MLCNIQTTSTIDAVLLTRKWSAAEATAGICNYFWVSLHTVAVDVLFSGPKTTHLKTLDIYSGLTFFGGKVWRQMSSIASTIHIAVATHLIPDRKQLNRQSFATYHV